MKINAIELAKQCGTPIRGHYDETGCTPSELQAFANAVLEEAAELCDELADSENGFGCAAAIREMKS